MLERSKKLGLTLIEVLVVMVVLTIGLLAVSTVIATAHLATIKGDYYNVAAKAAGDQIAACESAGYSGLTNGTTTASVSGLPNGSMTETVGQMGGNSNIREVDITVTWDGGSGQARIGGQVAASTAISAP
jgi:prepilin-type N-terminal cleavage/methylation domain-containing protein